MRKIAMLVANDIFPEDASIPPLRFTQNDASELGQILADQETCGFETKLYLNETSQKVLADLEQISGELQSDDTLLFYYAGHGKLRRDGQLCLASKDTTMANLGARSIRARDVLNYLQESHARRRVLILDCCHSGAIGQIYRGGDTDSALGGLAHSFGTYILTASTAIQLAEEREQEGHGVFTKALIDCLREPQKEYVTVDDWYDFAFKRLRISGNQTPRKWGLDVEGSSIEIGKFRQRLVRLPQTPKSIFVTLLGSAVLALTILVIYIGIAFAPKALIPAAALVPKDIRQALYHRGHALLIGVSDYTSGWAQLPSVKNDLQDLKVGLDPYFATVETVLNPTMAQLRERMREFLLDRNNPMDQWSNPHERLFIYYSGHGFTDFKHNSQHDEGYITGSDTPLQSTGRAAFNAVAFTDIIGWNKQSLAQHVLTVFDSCFSGSLFQTKGVTEPDQKDFDVVRKMLRKPIRYFITACNQDDEVSADSTFATLLLRGLRGEADPYHKGFISADELGIYLSSEVPRASRRSHTPQFANIGIITLSEGQFFFLTEPAVAGPSAQLPPTGAPPGK